MLVGQFARLFPADTPLAEIRGVLPANGPADGHARVVYVNGVWNELADEYAAMQDLADHYNVEVIGIHSMTFGRGSVGDIARSAGEKAGWRSPAVAAIIEVVEHAIHEHTPLVLVGHSEGALQISDGLRHAISDLRHETAADPTARAELEAELHALRVVTCGDAAVTYPGGPEYRHYQQVLDPIAVMFGHGHVLGIPLTLPLDLVTGERTVEFWKDHGLDVAGYHHFRDSAPGRGDGYVSRIDPAFIRGDPTGTDASDVIFAPAAAGPVPTDDTAATPTIPSEAEPGRRDDDEPSGEEAGEDEGADGGDTGGYAEPDDGEDTDEEEAVGYDGEDTDEDPELSGDAGGAGDEPYQGGGDPEPDEDVWEDDDGSHDAGRWQEDDRVHAGADPLGPGGDDDDTQHRFGGDALAYDGGGLYGAHESPASDWGDSPWGAEDDS